MEWLDGNKIQIIPPKRPKKLTGTRFATILGLNPWSTPFEIWCEVTRTYQKPFEDTIYTIAGKTIEPNLLHEQSGHADRHLGQRLLPSDLR